MKKNRTKTLLRDDDIMPGDLVANRKPFPIMIANNPGWSTSRDVRTQIVGDLKEGSRALCIGKVFDTYMNSWLFIIAKEGSGWAPGSAMKIVSEHEAR